MLNKSLCLKKLQKKILEGKIKTTNNSEPENMTGENSEAEKIN